MIRLRPVEDPDIAVIETRQANRDGAGEFGWFGFGQSGWLRKRFEERSLLTEERGTLAVEDDNGKLVGEVSWIRRDNASPPNGRCWNIGIWIAPEHRGRGYGTAAQRAVTDYLFAHTAYERIEAGTEMGNVAEQRALEKAGFSREGVLRRACFRDGEWRDMVLFSKLRGE